MEAFIVSGRVLDLILGLIALEALALLGWCVWRRQAPSAVALASNLASGAALVLALRASVTGAHWTVLAACLTGALVGHLIDLKLRFAVPRRGRLAAVAAAPVPEHRSARSRSWQAADLE